MKRVLSIKEVAEVLSISESTVRRLISNGDIEAVKIGGLWRISSLEINRILGENVSE